MTYSNVCSEYQGFISEAQEQNLTEEKAKEWAASFVCRLDTYEEVKDLAHHLGIVSVEVAHHFSLRAKLREAIVEEILEGENNWDGSDNSVDGVYIEPNYDYLEEEDDL